MPAEDEAVARACRAEGGEAIAISADVRDEEAVEALVEGTVAAYGGLDVLVAAAGLDLRETPTREDRFVRNVPLDLWRLVLDVNLTGTFLCCRAAIGPMAQRGGGSIITFTSGTVSKPLTSIAAYVSSKAGVEGLTRVLALEVADLGIRANVLQPGGPTNTAFFPGFVDEAERAHMHEPGIIRAAAVYLASDASRDVTGTSLVAREYNREHGLMLCRCPTCVDAMEQTRPPIAPTV